ncbi:preprotein translocase subunit YajC [Trebonia sp.]|uniref:preprotein translocase subunit YajC n=1 Tax=Trebonia sp. TaxID=2767075 RepID=UPI0026398EE4|nr:preprotein translocase subunit YajC [Trebonia sp.]
MGNIVLAATSSSSKSSFNPESLLLILVVVVGIYLLMIRPQRRRAQQAQQRQSTVTPGARVRTTAGMYATVVDVDGDDVVLEVAPGVEVRYMKRAIMDVVSPGQETEDPVADSADDEQDEPAEDDEWSEVDSDGVAESGSSKKD